MAARRTRKGRFTKQTRRRTSKYKKAINVPDAVLGIVTASAATSAFFDTNIIAFLTEGWLTDKTEATDMTYEVSLQELIQGKYGHKAYGTSLADTIKRNMDRNWMPAVGSVILAKIVTMGMKSLGVNKTLNRTVRSIGMGKMVKF